MKISFLVENSTKSEEIKAEHGLSLYIETEGMNILFDTGASELYLENAEKMGIDLSEADCCVISHGHYDHTGGVPSFVDLNKKAEVILHKDSFIKTYDMLPDGSLSELPTGIRWSEEDKEKVSNRAVFTDKELWLNDDIVVSGTIDNDIPYEMTEYFYSKDGDELIPDPMDHEQFLAIRENGKVFVFSGCSHRGVTPCLHHVRKLFPDDRIGGIVAGMHLMWAKDEVREKVIDEVVKLNLDMVMPVHCTGLTAIDELKEKLGERCIKAVTGDVYEY